MFTSMRKVKSSSFFLTSEEILRRQSSKVFHTLVLECPICAGSLWTQMRSFSPNNTMYDCKREPGWLVHGWISTLIPRLVEGFDSGSIYQIRVSRENMNPSVWPWNPIFQRQKILKRKNSNLNRSQILVLASTWRVWHLSLRTYTAKKWISVRFDYCQAFFYCPFLVLSYKSRTQKAKASQVFLQREGELIAMPQEWRSFELFKY